ncbi:uncharacterized protein LOC111322067 isoform X2 [Stylophora pistillata]|uniref:uncharacterized protein LOC111322067 isoform X2 n=1 Tax=Stylophora pistillata TaxID=50429 RepID=UPI000C054AAE|nr:uncharacterized protein LOC111322067 isoform X2 [Stylophora pistillata]
MIQRQQCVACNLMIPDSESIDTSCTCGHVYKEIKLIGGKRFSEYRAQLYSRLENRKQRLITGENKPFGERAQNKGKIEHICLLEGSCSLCPKTEEGARSDVIRREKEPSIRPKVIRRQLNQSQHIMKSKLSESKNTFTLGNLQRRFPIALTEINRRLVSQNQLWSLLDNRHKVVTDR